MKLKFAVISLACLLLGAASPSLEELKDPNCEFSKTKTTANPKELVDDFLTRDFNGGFLKADSWLVSAELCPGADLASDSSVVVKSYDVKEVENQGSIVEFQVDYEVLGHFEQANEGGKEVFIFNPSTSMETRRITAVSTPFGWRLKGMLMAGGQHVSPLAAIEHVDKNFKDKKFRPEDRSQLEKAAK